MADAGALPLEDGSVDGVFCSNLLEHTPDAAPVIAEIERVLRPGGWAYVSWTNWYSPWGGHDMTPYQYLGPERGPRLYERRHGKPRKNAYGDGLWACHIGPTLRLVRARPRLDDRARRAALLALGGARVPRPGTARARDVELRDPGAQAVTGEDRGLTPPEPPGWEEALSAARTVGGWMTEAQLRRLWEAARAAPDDAAIVEIGSFHGRSAIVLALGGGGAARVWAIDPHAGSDRGPGEIRGAFDTGERDKATFHANLAAAGVADRVEHVRRFSDMAHAEIAGEIDLLHVDGAHRYSPARDDVAGWGARVRPGGRMLIHDSFSSIGVTGAQLRLLVLSGEWRYLGRAGSLADYRREDLRGTERLTNGLRQLAQLPWFARNVAVKVLLTLRLRRLARALGADGWPY